MTMNRVVRLHRMLIALFCGVLSANADPTLSLTEPTIQKQSGTYRLRILGRFRGRDINCIIG